MKSTVLILSGLVLLTPWLRAQQEVEAEVQSSVIRPAEAGDEGPLRFGERRKFDPTEFVPKPMPDWAPVDHVGSNYALEYDPELGLERIISIAPSPITDSSGRVSGSDSDQGIPEHLIDSMGGFTGISSQTYPWSAACKMYFKQDAGSYSCSAQMIDPCHVITAGHCVHGGPGGGWSTDMVFIPAWDGDDDAYGSANGIKVVTWLGWTQSGSFDHDQAIVRLDRPVGALTGWHGYGWNSDDNWWLSQTWHAAGYPGSPAFPGPINYFHGTFDRIYTHRAEADFNPPAPAWMGGFSGTGMYQFTNGSRYVRCSISYSWPGGLPSQGVGAVRITKTGFDHYRDAFIPAGYASNVDYVPLDVSIENRERGKPRVRAGKKLGDFDYLVFNRSQMNPPLASVNVDVYASTNDNISTFDTKVQDHSFSHDFAAKGRVRVNVSGPTIPVSLTPGDYWLGVVVDELDADTSNNDTDGWDAAPFIVLEPIDSIQLLGPDSAQVKESVTLHFLEAPADSPWIMYYSKYLTGSTIQGHPFDIGRPGTAATGTTSSAGSGTFSFQVPKKALASGPVWYFEVRVDSGGFVYDSNPHKLTVTS